MISPARPRPNPFRRAAPLVLLGVVAVIGFWFTGREDAEREAHEVPARVVEEAEAASLDPATELAEGARLVEERRWEEAEARLRLALELGADEAEARYQLGRCLTGRKLFDHAQAELEEAVRLEPESARVRFALAELIGERFKADLDILTQMTLGTRGKKLLDQTIAFDPDHVDARLARILFFLAAPEFLGGGRERIAEEVEAIAAIDPAVGKFAEGWMAELDGKSARAKELFRASIALDPDYDRVRHRLGYLLLREGRVEDALAQFEAYRRIDPRHPHANAGLGLCRLEQGRPAEALEAFEVALDADPWLASAHFGRGMALAETGDEEAAAEALRAFLERAGPADVQRVRRAEAWLAERESAE